MVLDFDLGNADLVEFGVGLDEDEGSVFRLVPVDLTVQEALWDMVAATRDALDNFDEDPAEYEASDKHGGKENLFLNLNDGMAQQIRLLHQANNIPLDVNALLDAKKIFCYFTRLTDPQARRLTAIRRATQFKGVLRNRLLRIANDSLKLVEDRIFKLDTDFDMLVDSQKVHIFRPSGFEFVGELKEAILAAAPANVESIKADLPFLNLDSVKDFVSRHPRAARYLASIRASEATKDIDKGALKKLCNATGVATHERNGKIILDGDVMGLLEVLDRRRYEIELVKDTPEKFRAASRRKI